MSRFYGIYLKGKPNEPLDLTKLTNFERTGNLKSPKLYTLKELIKLTTKYDSELDFMNWRVRPVKILFDYNYAARNEIIELQQKYLDIFWNKLQSDSFIKEINN